MTQQIKQFCALVSLLVLVGILTQSFYYPNTHSAIFNIKTAQNDSITLELIADYECPNHDSDSYQMVNLRVVEEVRLFDSKIIRQYAPVKGLLFFTMDAKTSKRLCQLESLYTRTLDGEVVYIGYAIDLSSTRKNTRITLPTTACFQGTRFDLPRQIHTPDNNFTIANTQTQDNKIVTRR